MYAFFDVIHSLMLMANTLLLAHTRF